MSGRGFEGGGTGSLKEVSVMRHQAVPSKALLNFKNVV